MLFYFISLYIFDDAPKLSKMALKLNLGKPKDARVNRQRKRHVAPNVTGDDLICSLNNNCRVEFPFLLLPEINVEETKKGRRCGGRWL